MKSEKQIYFKLGILVLLFAAFIFLVILPIISSIKKNAQELITIKNDIVSFDNEISNLGFVKNQYQQFEPDLNKISTLFINSEVPIDFIRFLKKMAADSGVSIDISSVSSGKKEPWPTLYFQASTKSTFVNLARFLEKLENSDYLIGTQNITINKSDSDGKGTKNVDANFLLKVYAK
jgi:hypothetical protein